MDNAVFDYLIGGGGAAGLALLLVLTGQLVPKRYHDRVIRQNAKLEEAYQTMQRTAEDERAQASKLASGTQLSNQLVGALVQLARPGYDPAGGGHGPPLAEQPARADPALTEADP